MKILYFDLGMGAAGDMLSAALLELFPESERQGVIDKLNALGIPKVHFEAEPAAKCGITGTHMSVRVDGIEEGEELREHGHGHSHEEHHHEHNHEEHHHEHSHEEHNHEHACEEHHHEEHHHEHESELHVHAEHYSCAEPYHGSEAEDAGEHGHEHSHEEHHHEHTHGGHAHTHNSMTGIEHIINDHMELPEEVREHIKAVYGLLAEAESHVHGVPVREIHFHEVGNMDAVADVTAVSYMLYLLKPDRIAASAVNTGSGKVRCAHGIMPVPAPATAYLLQGIPSYDNGIRGELLTPTGAALIRHFAESFGARPVMSIERVGYGMGRKDFEAANCVRAILGESSEAQEHNPEHNQKHNPERDSEHNHEPDHDHHHELNHEHNPERSLAHNSECNSEHNPVHTHEYNHEQEDELTGVTVELSANIDDMSAEELGYAFEQLLKAGALDVWTESIHMKKQRQGTLLKLLCRESMRDTMVRAIFKYTSTIGVRESVMRRYTLKRELLEYDTTLGKVHIKHVTGYGTDRGKLEYEDLAAIADKQHISVAEARRLVMKELAFFAGSGYAIS